MIKKVCCVLFGYAVACCFDVNAQTSKIASSENGLNAPQVVMPANETVFSFVEQMPEFPGGQNGLMQYLSRNLRYPESAINADIQGRVYVKFVVCTDGSLCNEAIVTSVDTALDREVLRVVRAMPNWKPGKQNDKTVKTYFTLPVTFRLEDDAEKETTDKAVDLQETK